MCFAKQLFLLFLVNQEKLLVVLAKCLKNLSNVMPSDKHYALEEVK